MEWEYINKEISLPDDYQWNIIINRFNLTTKTLC